MSLAARAGEPVHAWRAPSELGLDSAVAVHEECYICYEQRPTSAFVTFGPCGHGSCISCMKDLRKRAISKAAKGVECPLCRAFVEHYKPLDPKNVEVSEACNQATAVAHRAAQARLGFIEKPKPVHSHSDAHSAIRQGWTCSFPGCQKSNRMAAEVCQHCGKPRVEIPIRHVSESKDILHMTPDEVRHCGMVKFFPGLARAITDLGLDLVNGRVQMTNETAIWASLSSTLPKGGADRLFHVVECLSAAFYMKQLSYHFFGNYLVQTLLRVAERLAALPSPLARRLDTVTERRAVGVFRAVFSPLQGDLVDMALHKQASHVIDLVIGLAGPDDLCDVAGELAAGAPRLLKQIGGQHVLRRLVERLVALASDPGVDAATFNKVHKLMGTLCEWASMDRVALLQIMQTPGISAVISMMEFGCPQIGSFWLAEEMAKLVPAVLLNAEGLISESAIHNLKALVGIQAKHQLASACIFRDIVCLIAFHLMGHLATLGGGSSGSVSLLSTILQRLVEEQEREWLDYMLRELIQALATDLQLLDDLTSVMAETLSSALLDDVYVDSLLNMASTVNPHAYNTLASKVNAIRVPGLPPPHEKYYAPSCIQYTALEDMQTGLLIPPPAPPQQTGHQPSSPILSPTSQHYHPPHSPILADPEPDPLPEPIPEAVASASDCEIGFAAMNVGGWEHVKGNTSPGAACPALRLSPSASSGVQSDANAPKFAVVLPSAAQLGGASHADIWAVTPSEFRSFGAVANPAGKSTGRSSAFLGNLQSGASAAMTPSAASGFRGTFGADAAGAFSDGVVASRGHAEPVHPPVPPPGYGGMRASAAPTSSSEDVPGAIGDAALELGRPQVHAAGPFGDPAAGGVLSTRPDTEEGSRDLPMAQAESWACRVCTYHHSSDEALYLLCAICGHHRHG